MKILALSDLHNSITNAVQFRELAIKEKVDLIIFAGDFTQFGPEDMLKTILSALTKEKTPMVATIGNCDPDWSCDILDSFDVNILGKHKHVGDIIVVGIEGSISVPFSYFEDFLSKQDELTEVVEVFGSENIIFVSHAPPKNTSTAQVFTGRDAGSEALFELIEEYQPLLCICGHIHEGVGMDHIGKTVVVNPGAAKDGQYALISIENNKVDVQLGEL